MIWLIIGESSLSMLDMNHSYQQASGIILTGPVFWSEIEELILIRWFPGNDSAFKPRPYIFIRAEVRFIPEA